MNKDAEAGLNHPTIQEVDEKNVVKNEAPSTNNISDGKGKKWLNCCLCNFLRGMQTSWRGTQS